MDSKPRILVIAERYLPHGGGAEFATHVTLGILREYFEIKVLTGVRDPVRHVDVEYIYEPLLSRWEKPILWMNILRLIKKERFRRLVNNVDIVYIPRLAYPVIPYLKKLGKNIVIHLHDYAPITYTATVMAPFEEHRRRIHLDSIRIECTRSPMHCLSSITLYWLPKLIHKWLSMTDGIICVSKRQAEIIGVVIPRLIDKITVIYNPVPREWLIHDTTVKDLYDTPLFLYIGGGSYIKGFKVLVDALNTICKRDLGIEFIFTGFYDNRSTRILKSLSNACSINVKILGSIKHSTLEKLYGKTWALVSPSIIEEPLPYAVVEAGIFQVIPLASRTGGVVELLSGTRIGDYMHKPGDSRELALHILRVAEMSSREVFELSSEISMKMKSMLRDVEYSIIKYFKSLAA